VLNRFIIIIRAGALALIYYVWFIYYVWLCISDKVFNDKILLSCRLSTGAQLFSIHDRLYNMWRIETYLWRCLHG
jgi:hypothetical protein